MISRVGAEEWALHHAFFSRHGFTEAAQDEALRQAPFDRLRTSLRQAQEGPQDRAARAGALLMDLETLDSDLAHA